MIADPGSQQHAVPPPIGPRDAASIITATDAEALALLQSAPGGLPAQDAARRLRQVGANVLPAPRPPSPLRLFLAQVTHTLALLLWAAAGLALLAGLPQIGWAILAIIGINAIFSFWQEYRASRLVEALHRRMAPRARVRRDGSELPVRARDVVPGDIVVLRRGDRVVADVRLVRAADLRADYSILTGESEPVARRHGPAAPASLMDAPNCVLAGTTIVEGAGEGVVFATGRNTVFGRMATLTERLYLEPSPLQRQLTSTAHTIAAVAIAIGLVFFAGGEITGRLSTKDSFTFGLGILVAIIPEGLLPTVSLALALAVQRMAQRHAIVKRLSSVETLGCTDVICTDKTGTITTNEMTVREVWAGDAHYTVSGRGYELRGSLRRTPRSDSSDPPELEWLLRCGVLCNHGIVPQRRHHHTGLGDPIDEALLVLAVKAGVDPSAERQARPLVREFPFDAARRLMSTLHEDNGRVLLCLKGGPAETLARCRTEMIEGAVRGLTPERRQELLRRSDALSDAGLRVLALALRSLPGGALPTRAEEAEAGLTLLGLVGMDNPLRPEVPEAVERCRSAGIHVVMLTGDHSHTAQTVARQAHIAGEAVEPVTGAQLDRMSDAELAHLLRHQRPPVFARVTPEQKLRLVRTYRDLGHVVAVTGDGVNDAPALRAADIGIAMGRRGTDVAREAADMVLTDDNFATIVAAVQEGRAVYENIRKFLTYYLTSNVAEAAPFVLFVLFNVPLPLTVLQVLLVDLGTDILPGLALGVDPAGKQVMQLPPRALHERMVTGGLLTRALGYLGLWAALLSLSAYFYFQWDVTGSLFGPYVSVGPLYRQATTVTLAGIVACQVANAFACRSAWQSVLRTGLGGNRALLAAVAAEVALLAALIGIPPLRAVFGLEPIGVRYWPVLAALPPLFLLAEEARKLALRLIWRRRRVRPGQQPF